MNQEKVVWYKQDYDINNLSLELKYLKDFYYNLMKKLYGQPPFPEIVKNDYNNHLIRLMDKKYNIIECYKILTERLNLGDFETIWNDALNYIDDKIKEFDKSNPKDKPRIELTGLGRRVIDFSKDLGEIFKGNTMMFYKPKEQRIVKIGSHFDKMLGRDITIFQTINKEMLINIMEENVVTYIKIFNKNFNSFEETIKSPTKTLSELVLCNEEFIKGLYNVNRFLKFPLPFINKETNKLLITKKGYDKKHEAFFTAETPDSELMDIQKAKDEIIKILDSFCFENEIDKTLAISYLITPCCRGLYGDITERTPLYLIKANRERAGKDYLAGVVGILYEGKAIDDTPISNGEKGQQSNAELRKKITSGLIQGRRRFHSSNNKGFLNNSEFERILTTKTHRDRVLGQNKEVELDNEMEFSMSANWGLTYTADLWHRCRPINLFFSEEDPNKRKFKIPDLHGYVLNNRPKILSAIITLINDWVENGMIKGKTAFTSYPRWAEIVGGIMTHHNLGDPCVKVEDDDIGGDKQTEDVKLFIECMYELTRKGLKKQFISKELLDIISSNQKEWGIFLHYDLEVEPQKRNQVIKSINKYINREFSKIKFKCLKETKKSSGWKYSFEKQGEDIKKDDDKIETNLYQEHSKELKIDKKSIVEADEEVIENDDELIHLKCSICGLSPCKDWSKIGKPLCELCVDKK